MDERAEYGQPPPQWSVRGVNDSEALDQIYSTFATPSSQQCWSDGGSIVSSRAQYSPTVSDQRQVIRQPEQLDTSLSAPFWTRANFAPSPAPLTGPTHPGRGLIEHGQEANLGAHSSTFGTSAAYSDRTRRPGMFYLGIDDPFNFKTWVVCTPWSSQPHSMLPIDELQALRTWTPLSIELTDTLNREYQISNPVTYTRLNTLVRWLLTTVVSTNPECRKWRKYRQSQRPCFQKKHRCEDLRGIFFDGNPPNGPFRHDTIPKPVRTSRAQLETVIHEWMRELALCKDVHWISFRQGATVTASYPSVAKCFRLVSGSSSSVPGQVLAPKSPTQKHSATDAVPTQRWRLQRSDVSSSPHTRRFSGDRRSIQGQTLDRRSRAWRGQKKQGDPEAAKSDHGGTSSVFSLKKRRLRGELAAAEISSQRQQGTPTSLMRHVGDFSQFSSQPSNNVASGIASQFDEGVGTLTVPQPWATFNQEWDARGEVSRTAHRAPVIQETAHYPWGHQDWQSQQGVVVTQQDLPGPSWTPVDHMSYYQWGDQSSITRPPDPGICS